MLDLLVGIPLTIAAWKRGWKGWALLPMGLGLVSAFIAGFIIGGIATTEDEFWGMFLFAAVLIYVAEYGALITMVVKKRDPKVNISNQLPVGPAAIPGSENCRSARYCTSCGQEIGESAQFCRNCGQVAGRTMNGGTPLAGQYR
ncbi:MAG: zinc ribbon domain-containing protein [Dehalococcoidia bacterium]|nr:zinc ribbon domain-containing protein [Dehalococcoidia bacterium]